MRGDSLRDLYAKSVALLGLGLLGAIGAAVDYWPTDVALPETVAVNLNPVAFGQLSARASSPEPLPFATVHQSIVVTAERPADVAIIPASLETVSVSMAEPEPETPVPADLPTMVPAQFTGLDGGSGAVNEVALSTVDAPRIFKMTTTAPPQVRAAAAHQSLIAGIGSGIEKAGSKVKDGLSAFGGAVGGAVVGLGKRLNPF